VSEAAFRAFSQYTIVRSEQLLDETWKRGVANVTPKTNARNASRFDLAETLDRSRDRTLIFSSNGLMERFLALPLTRARNNNAWIA